MLTLLPSNQFSVLPLQAADAKPVPGTDMHKLMHSFGYNSLASDVLHKAKHKYLDHAHLRDL